MLLFLTAVDARTGVARDLTIDAEDDTTIGDLAGALAGNYALPAPDNGDAAVRLLRSAPSITGESSPGTPGLFLRGVRLPDDTVLKSSAVRHGAVIGIGGPVADPSIEPAGAVDLRCTGGEGSGLVHRLSVGSYQLGLEHSALPLVPDSPEVAVYLDVDVYGEVRLRPAATDFGTIPAPERRVPLDGPIIVGDQLPEPPKRRWWQRKKQSMESLSTSRDTISPEDPLPYLRLDREPVTAEVVWEPGMVLGIGRQYFELTTVTAPDASLVPSSDGATMDYNRPPRLLPKVRKTEFSLPGVPHRPDKMPIPILVVFAPLLMSGASYLFTHSPYTLLFAAMSPLMMIANFTSSRRMQKTQYIRQLAEYHDRLRKVEQDAFDSLVEERGARRRDCPDPASLLLFANGPRARLWERRPQDPDWLVVRIGTADVPSAVTVKDPSRMQHEGPMHWTAPDVPAVVPLAKTGVVGIAGSAEMRRAVARSIVIQLATMHSPANLRMAVITTPGQRENWTWSPWLPHLRRRDSTLGLASVATDLETAGRRVNELLAEIEQRKALEEQQIPYSDQIVVVLDGANELRRNGGVVTLLRQGPRYGIFLICLDEDQRQLPEECRALVIGTTDEVSLATTQEATLEGIQPDLVPISWCDRLARALAPVRDATADGAASSLPDSSRLLDVLRLNDPTGDDIIGRWATGGRTTRAVIGEGIDGTFSLDIRTDGPHGLVAGTTGSGKSELLQTIIASLAVGNRPDEFTFVLVDYKGGAAFKDCKLLPHTVGMVTDLDGHLTTRALESLGAELRRREHQLADADAKDIDDYLAAKESGDAPMPRLLLVIDEFAAMVSELPDFVDGLVDIARRGRSLGVHLILATQRPSGVVSAEIKSNTNLRIALRVTDQQDSSDVIDASDAAHISKSTPGRALARLGHSSLIPFQSARVGGRPRGEQVRSDVNVQAFDVMSAARGQAMVVVDDEDDMSTPTDLTSLVRAIDSATSKLAIPPIPSPWLPALGEEITLDDLELPKRVEREVPPLPIGLADIPHQQSQRTETWDLPKAGHLVIAGANRMGRSTALRCIAGAVGRFCDPRDVHLFGIDAGNGALLPMLSLPHTGAVVQRNQVDRMYRLLGLLNAEVTRRQQLLAQQGFADINEQRNAVEPTDRLPYLVVLLDRLEGYVAAFESLDGGVLIDQVTSLLQEGAGVGIRVVVSSDRSGVMGRVSTLVEDRIMLRMPDSADFAVIGMRSKDVPTSMPPGRGFRAAERPREVQLALLAEDPTGVAQVAALQQIGRTATDEAGQLTAAERPMRVDELPLSISVPAALELAGDEPLGQSQVAVGVGGDTLGLLRYDPALDGPGFIVAGPPRSGKSSALTFMVKEATQRDWRVILITPRISPLRSPRIKRGVNARFTADTDPAEIDKLLKSVSSRHLVVLDDFDVLGPDHPISDVVNQHYARLRDTGNAVVVACGLDEVSGYYRGLTSEVRKGRTGLLLAPRSSSDGDVISVRLPRSATAAMPAGRGVFARPGGWAWTQVPFEG
ncbi:FtsK/SpoIIIE domain-containing protein [Kribbella sp. NPDC049227]|uniref:FtsK/SpoIIIE domain-containing protein n=1 Tax=Kribbella sp. NPDC049227 TaxID=3364113 RepID=UPI0037190D1B